ncbi:MAG: sulfite exporter TauE/SafE family protein [Nitrospirae bacterium]|nr:MAG: sulfite exporter TauE/SafE family protein [Nitrospirota bacterium]
MNAFDSLFLTVLIFAAALLYSSVGHGGASGYLAAMALVGLAPGMMKPTALSLNILVSLIATVRFYRAGGFSWRIFLQFAATSIPFAFIGGTLSLPGTFYRPVIGLVLLFAAFQLFRHTQKRADIDSRPVPLSAAILWGAGIGLLSGLTGVGGGIFLSPLLLFKGWANPREAAGISAAFIFVNSVAGILGYYSKIQALPDTLVFFGIAAVAGGIIGSGLGSRHFSGVALRRLMASVVAVAGLKFILS